MMNIYHFPKFLATLAFSLFIVNSLFAQLNPYPSLEGGQNWNESFNHLGVFQASEIIQGGAAGASATDAIRFSFLMQEDLPCDYNNCPSEYSNTFSDIKYKKSNGQWQTIAKVEKNGPGVEVMNTYNYFDHNIQIPGACPLYQQANYEGSGPCFTSVWQFWNWGNLYNEDCAYHQWYVAGNYPSNCTAQGDLLVPVYGEYGNAWNFNPTKQTTNYGVRGSGNWATFTFDWLDIPNDLYESENKQIDFRITVNGSLVNFSMTLNREWGSGNIPNLSSQYYTTSDDNNIIVHGPNNFSDCNGAIDFEEWYAESSSIWGDSNPHLISLPNSATSSSSDIAKYIKGYNDINFGPDFTFDYKIHHKIQTHQCISFKTVDLSVISTQSVVGIENLIATNTSDGNVKVEWGHPTHITNPFIKYTITRNSIFDNITRTVYVSDYNSNLTNHTSNTPLYNHLDDGRLHFIDRNADPSKTYLYTLSIETTESNTGPQIANTITSLSGFFKGTGAGIPFFNSLNLAEQGSDIYIDSLSTSHCSQYLLSGNQEMFGDSDILLNGVQATGLNSVVLSFDPTIAGTSKQKLELFENYNNDLESLRLNHYVEGFNATTGEETNTENGATPQNVSIETSEFEYFIEIPADTYLPNSYGVYPVISATRSDGKKFRTFENIEIDLYERGKPISPEIYDKAFKQYNVFEFSDQTNDVKVDEIFIQRVEVLTEFTSKSRYIAYKREGDEFVINSSSEAPLNVSVLEDSLGIGTERISSNDVEESMRIIETVFDSESGTRKMIWSDQLADKNGQINKTQICVDYHYTVWVRNCGNDYTLRRSNTETITPVQTEAIFEPVANGDYTHNIIDTDISTLKNLTVSKGTHEDKIHISWDNLADGIVNFFTIERRVFGDKGIGSWQEIGVHTIGEKYFEDLYAQSNVLYEYRIQAWVGNCVPEDVSPVDANGETPSEQEQAIMNNGSLSDAEISDSLLTLLPEVADMQGGNSSSYQIGFRRPTARINGQIIFENSTIPAPYVNVKAEVILDGGVSVTNTSYDMGLGYASFETPPFLNVNDVDLETFTLSFWMNNTNNDDAVVFSRFSTEKWMNIEVKDNKIRYRENYEGWVDSTQFHDLLTNEDVFSSQNWNKITLSFDKNADAERLKFYVNGVLKDSLLSSFDPSSQDQMNFGSSFNLKVK